MQAALLDTDMLSEVVKLRNAAVRRKALSYRLQHGQLAFSAITRYEITRGYKDQNATTQFSRFIKFCENSLVLPVTDDVFDRAADLWVMARKGE